MLRAPLRKAGGASWVLLEKPGTQEPREQHLPCRECQSHAELWPQRPWALSQEGCSESSTAPGPIRSQVTGHRRSSAQGPLPGAPPTDTGSCPLQAGGDLTKAIGAREGTAIQQPQGCLILLYPHRGSLLEPQRAGSGPRGGGQPPEPVLGVRALGGGGTVGARSTCLSPRSAPAGL